MRLRNDHRMFIVLVIYSFIFVIQSGACKTDGEKCQDTDVSCLVSRAGQDNEIGFPQDSVLECFISEL